MYYNSSFFYPHTMCNYHFSQENNCISRDKTTTPESRLYFSNTYSVKEALKFYWDNTTGNLLTFN